MSVRPLAVAMIKNSVWYADTAAVKNQFGDVTLGGTQHLQTTKMFTIQGQGSQIVHEIFTTVLNCQLSIVRHLTPSKYYHDWGRGVKCRMGCYYKTILTLTRSLTVWYDPSLLSSLLCEPCRASQSEVRAILYCRHPGHYCNSHTPQPSSHLACACQNILRISI